MDIAKALVTFPNLCRIVLARGIQALCAIIRRLCEYAKQISMSAGRVICPGCKHWAELLVL